MARTVDDPAVRAIFLDVGNTLIGEARPMADVVVEALAAAGVDVSSAVAGGEDAGDALAASAAEQAAEQVLPGAPAPTYDAIVAAIRRADAALWHDSRWARDYWHDPERIYAMWVGYYARVFGDLGRPDADARLARHMIDYYQSPPAWAPYPETRAVLAKLRERGLVVGAISDWGSALTGILAGHGLLDYFDFVLISANIGIAKPQTSLYQLALTRAGVRPEEALMVGDSYHSDILGARSAGIPGLLLDRRRALPPLDCPVIHDLWGVLEERGARS